MNTKELNENNSFSNPLDKKEKKEYTYEYIPHRGLTKETLSFFRIKSKIDEDGIPVSVSFPYRRGSKIRSLDQKDFFSEGDMRGGQLFASDRFPAGSAKYVTITEGEYDAASVYQILGSRFPSVSIRGAATAKIDCLAERDYLQTFERIYLAFDGDEPGQRAAREVADLFGYEKIFLVKQNEFKDANEYLTAGAEKEFKNAWYAAKKFQPESVISSYEDFFKILRDAGTRKGIKLPFPTLQHMCSGLRTSELFLWTGLEGTGKTEILRRIESYILQETDEAIGVIHLEEPKDRLLRGLAGHELQTPLHLEESHVSADEVEKALTRLTKRDNRLHIYKHSGTNDPSDILDQIRYLRGCGCRYIFFDHIGASVAGLVDEDERRALDKICNTLDHMVNDLDFHLSFISHVNDNNQTRGSRYISKVAHTWVHVERDTRTDNDFMRNVTNLTIFKNRPTSRSGPAGKLIFNPETYMLTEWDQKEVPVA